MVSEHVPVRPPVEVVRPVAVQVLPSESAWPSGPTRFEIKYDGWRAIGGVMEDGPVLFSRQGGDLRAFFPEVLDALGELPLGTVLDGELCAVVDGRMDFQALAHRRGRDRHKWPPVAYVVFDLLATTGMDLRPHPLQERLQRMGELLETAPPVLQAVLATADRQEALRFAQELRPAGVEGLVAKGLGTLYVPRRTRWVKRRYSETVDVPVLRAIGPPTRPSRLVVRLPDGSEAATNQLTPLQRSAVGRTLARHPSGVWAEVSWSPTRHRTLRFVRLREDLLDEP